MARFFFQSVAAVTAAALRIAPYGFPPRNAYEAFHGGPTRTRGEADLGLERRAAVEKLSPPREERTTHSGTYGTPRSPPASWKAGESRNFSKQKGSSSRLASGLLRDREAALKREGCRNFYGLRSAKDGGSPCPRGRQISLPAKPSASFHPLRAKTSRILEAAQRLTRPSTRPRPRKCQFPHAASPSSVLPRA